MLLHEDYPHTIPTRAWLRWKENYFWVFMDPDRDVCCLYHVSTEPTLDRAYTSFTLVHKGREIRKAGEVPVPAPFEHSPVLTYGNLTIRFLKPQAEFQVSYEDADIAATLNLTRRMHLFDFQACADVNPDQFSLSENTAMDRHGFRHQGQCLNGTGEVRFKTGDQAGQAIAVSGTGYRDHSWGMRNDQLTLDHHWAFINLPSNGAHFIRVRNAMRPENTAYEGYIASAEGNMVARRLEIEDVGQGAHEMPEEVVFRATGMDGKPYTFIAEVGKSFARLPLITQKPGSKVYKMVENMCPCRCVETGETGFANVEIGWLADKA